MQNLNYHFDNYIDECEHIRLLRPATIRVSREAFQHLLAMMPEIKSLEDISSSIITCFFKRLRTRERIFGRNAKIIGIKDSTLVSYASRLKTFFSWLKIRGLISRNPFDGIILPKPMFNDHRALKGGEIKKIMGAVVQYAPNAFLMKRDIAMIGILTFCGLRRNELISLELHDIDLFNDFITVQAKTSKSKRQRKIPINIFLKRYLADYLEERKKRRCTTSHFFLSNGRDTRFTLHGLKHWVERLSKQSGVKFHVHRYRHTFATNLAKQNVGAIKIQKLMGHSDLKMTETYLRSLTSEEMGDDINKLSFDNLA